MEGKLTLTTGKGERRHTVRERGRKEWGADDGQVRGRMEGKG